MTGYAYVLHRRGLSGQARSLLARSLEMAKQSHNQGEIRRIEEAMAEIDKFILL